MSVISNISGTAIPLDRDDVDTDRIIPARFLRQLTFEDLGRHVFEDDRRAVADSGEVHPFDQPERQNAVVLMVGQNFGAGSSREHAPQAIYRWGIRAIVGVSFGEIFAGNAATIGLPCLTVSNEVAKELMADALDPAADFQLDLVTKTIECGGNRWRFDINESQRQRFVAGNWDSLSELSSDIDAIQKTAARLPYLNHWAVEIRADI